MDNDNMSLAMSDNLRVYHWMTGVRDILGPKNRAVVWVQGCSLACPGCIAPEMWPVDGGILYNPVTLAEQLLEDDIDGVTISGGEPTEQARSVSKLLEVIKSAGKTTWVYTGYTFEDLQARNDEDINGLLSFVDVLVDGSFIKDNDTGATYTGSANQRIIHLTDAIAVEDIPKDKQSRIQVSITIDGQMVIVGVPPSGFLAKFRSGLIRRGLNITPENEW